MHKYLRAIGFGQIKNRKQLQILLTDCIRTANYRDYFSFSSEGDFIFVECCKEFAEGMGIAVRGELRWTAICRRTMGNPLWLQ